MTSNRERIALVSLVLSAVSGGIAFALLRRTGAAAPVALVPLAAWAAATSLFAFIRLRLAATAEQERRDEAHARREHPETALFAGGEAAPFTAGRSLAQFERWVLGLLPLFFAAGLGAGAWWTWHVAASAVKVPPDHLLTAAFCGGAAFFLFLVGRLQVGLAREEGGAALRGSGIAAGVVSFASVAVAVLAVATGTLEQPDIDRAAGRGLAVVLGVLAAEQIGRLVLALYSPRHRRAHLTAHESRIGQLVAEPGAWARSFAQTVDYQFGFNVSESWLFRLLRNALAPLLIFQLVVLYAMSCLVFLEPHEEAVLERLGKPRAGAWHLQPGFHLKLPWPFETVQRVPARRVMTAWVGFDAADATNRPAVITWNVPHYRKEDSYVVASRIPAGGDAVPASLVSINIPIEYRVTNLLAYVYGTREPQTLIEAFANRALTRAAAQHDLSDFLGARRAAIGDTLRTDLQRDVDQAGLGVEILFSGVQGVHPPVQVADAFESVVGAIEQREAAILSARAYTNEILPVAHANADKLRREAEAYRTRRTELAAAEVDQFEKRRAAFKTAPEVFRANLYLNTLRDSLTGARKFIVDAPGSKQVLLLNLEEKPYQDLLDLGNSFAPAAKETR